MIPNNYPQNCVGKIAKPSFRPIAPPSGQLMYQNYFFLTDNKLPCSGDSGGGLIVSNFRAGNHIATLVGVVSFGPPRHNNIENGRPAPNVFTRVNNYYDWIMDKINNR